MSAPPPKIPPPPPVSRPSPNASQQQQQHPGVPSPPRTGPKIPPTKSAAAPVPPASYQQQQQQQAPASGNNNNNVNPLNASASGSSYTNTNTGSPTYQQQPQQNQQNQQNQNQNTSSGNNNNNNAPMNASVSGGATSSYAPSPSSSSHQQQQNQNQQQQQQQQQPQQSSSGAPLAPQTSIGGGTGGPKLVGSASVSHPAVPQVKRRPSPVRPGNSPTAGSGSGSGSYAQQQQQPQHPPTTRPNPSPSGSGATGAPVPPGHYNNTNANNNNNNAANQFTQSSSFAPSGQQQQPPRTNNSSPPKNTSQQQQQQQQPRIGGGGGPPPNVSPPRSQPNYNKNVNNNNNNNNSQILPNTGGVSPIPVQSSLVSSPPRSATGRPRNDDQENNSSHNVSWAEEDRSRVESLRRYEREMSANRQAVSGVSARRLAPPEDDALHTSVVTEQVDTVGLHRTNIQEAINSSHYAVSGSQFPLSVVPQSKSKTRGMSSTVDGCINVEILVMISGAHGSGLVSKCDEVRIVNVDPARTTIRRLLNLAHKAINFVPVARGAFQMSARTLATRRIGITDKPVVTPIPLPNDVSSITEMVTLSEDDLVESIPIRDNDVLNWVDVDPVSTPTFSATSPNADRSLHRPQDMRLVGSPNRDIVSSTRLPRATHYNDPSEYISTSTASFNHHHASNNFTNSSGIPERVINVPLAQDHLEFERMSPRRELRKEPGNGNASLAHRQISGKIGNNNNNNNNMNATTTPSWRNGAADETNSSRRIAESLNSSTPNMRSSSYSNQHQQKDVVPHSSIAQYANSSLRSASGISNSNTTNNNSSSPSASRRSQQQQQPLSGTTNPISLSSGEVIHPRSEEERRLVEEIRAIRRDISSSRN